MRNKLIQSSYGYTCFQPPPPPLPLSPKPSHTHYHFRAIKWRRICRGCCTNALPMTCLKHVHDSTAMRMLWNGTKRDVMEKTKNATFRQVKSCITLQRPFSNPCSQRAIPFGGRRGGSGGGSKERHEESTPHPPQPNISQKDTSNVFQCSRWSKRGCKWLQRVK
jgi:hypothetical protein